MEKNQFILNKGLKGTIVNRTCQCHEGLTLTVPLNDMFYHYLQTNLGVETEIQIIFKDFILDKTLDSFFLKPTFQEPAIHTISTGRRI